MKKNVINEIDQMKFLFDYKQGKVLSEQLVRPKVKVGVADATTLALKSSLSVIDYYALGKLTFDQLKSKIDEIIEPIAKNLDEVEADNFRRQVKQKLDEIGSVRGKADDIKTAVADKLNVLKKALNDMENDVRIKTEELEARYAKIKEDILNNLAKNKDLIQAWKDNLINVLNDISSKYNKKYGEVLIDKSKNPKTLRDNIKGALKANDEAYLNTSTRSAKEKEAIKKVFKETLEDRVDVAMNELRQTQAYKDKYPLAGNKKDIKVSELNPKNRDKYTDLQNKGDNLSDAEKRQLKDFDDYFQDKITEEELTTRLDEIDEIEGVVGKGNYTNGYENIFKKPESTRTPEENFMLRQVQEVKDKLITPEQARKRIENFNKLDPKERAYYNEIVNKTPKTKEETLYKEYVDEYVKLGDDKLREKIRQNRYRQEGIIEPWWNNNMLRNFYTNWIEPMFRYRIKRFLTLAKGRTSITTKTLEQLQARMYSAFQSASGQTPKMNANIRRLLRDLLDLSQNSELRNALRNAEGKNIESFDDLINKIKEDLKGKLNEEETATLDAWIDNVKNLKRDRRDIGFDELLTGSKSKEKENVTDIVKNEYNKNKESYKKSTGEMVSDFFKRHRERIYNLIFHGKFKSPADFQKQMYEKAISEGKWTRKNPNNLQQDMNLFTRSDAAKSLAQHYAIVYFALPALLVISEFIYDLVRSLTLGTQEDVDSAAEYLQTFVDDILLFTPVSMFYKNMESEDEIMLDLLTSLSPTYLDNSIVYLINAYEERPKNPEEKIQIETKEDIAKLYNKNKEQIKYYNDESQIQGIDHKIFKSQSFNINNKTNAPFFLSKERVSEGDFSDNFRISMIKYLQPKNKNYRIIQSPLGANPFVLFEIYRQRVIKEKEDPNYLQKAKDFFKSVLDDPSKLAEAIEQLPQETKDNIPNIEPQIKKNGKHYTLIMRDSKIYYYVTDYETMIQAIESGSFENAEQLLEKKPIREFGSINENYQNIKNMNNIILEKIKKVIMEEEEEKTLKMKDWDEIFTFQKVDEKNPGKYSDVKLKMDSVMDRMPHWRKKYNKQCEDLENCDEDGEDDSFVRAVIDTHPEVVRILFTKGLAHLTSSDDQEDLNEGLHSLLKVIREAKNVEVEVWSVYRHPSSPEKIWSLVKGDYKPKELESMDMKMQQSPQNNVEKKKNSLDELKKKEDDAIKLLSIDEKKGLLELPIKIRSKIKEKIKKGWTTEKPENNLNSFFKEDDVDSVFSEPIKIYKLKPNSDFIEYIEKENMSNNIKRGFCRAIFYLEKERDFKEKTKEKIDSILDKCENKFDGKYGQNYL